MLAIIKTINGVKKIVKVTADAGAGNPVGTIIPMYKKSSPSGYLYCDGSTFDQTKYPLLYAYLGSNVLPDYREFALVGAEQNTTDVYNASTNPNGTIHDHDVYTEGQAKDDQLQTHSHNTYVNGDTDHPFKVANGYVGRDASGWGFDGSTFNLVAMGNRSGRMGSVTRGKRKAVYFYIKATSGLSENAQDNVINTLNEQRSFSTEEHLTGRKWIDGKPTYERSFSVSAIGTEEWTNVTNDSWINTMARIIDCVVSADNIGYGGYGGHPKTRIYNGYLQAWELAGYSTGVMTIEYTKTTD